MVPAQDRRGTRGERRGREPVDGSGARWWTGQHQAQTALRACPEAVRRATRPLAPCARARSRILRFPRTGLDPRTSGRRYPQGVRCLVGPAAHRTNLGQDRLDSAEAHPTRSAARRAGHRAVAHREMASTQKGAEHNGQSIWFIDESGFYPLPAVVRSCSPRGHTPVLREWSMRDHLSAFCAISPEGAVHLVMQGGGVQLQNRRRLSPAPSAGGPGQAPHPLGRLAYPPR